MKGWKRWTGDQHRPPPVTPRNCLVSAAPGPPALTAPSSRTSQQTAANGGLLLASAAGRGSRDWGWDVTGPYLNMRPHHGGVGVVGEQLGAEGALGQDQVGWEG